MKSHQRTIYPGRIRLYTAVSGSHFERFIRATVHWLLVLPQEVYLITLEELCYFQEKILLKFIILKRICFLIFTCTINVRLRWVYITPKKCFSTR